MNAKRQTDSWQWREVLWNETLSPGQATEVLQRLATSPTLGMIALELRADHKGLRWLIAAHPRQIDALKQILLTHAPVRVVTPRRVRSRLQFGARLAVTGAGLQDRPEVGISTVRALYGQAAALLPGQELVVQVLLGRRVPPWVLAQPLSPSWIDLIIGSAPKDDSSNTKGNSGEHGFLATIRLGANAKSPLTAKKLLSNGFGVFSGQETPKSRLRVVQVNPVRLDAVTRPWTWPLRIRPSELAPFTGWPIGEPPLPVFGSTHPRVVSPSTPLVHSERIVGITSAPGHEERLSIPISDAAFHSYLLGPTGSGKSTVMLSMILADISKHRGVVVFDPKGDLATDVLSRIPSNRLDDVVVLDPSSPHPVGFNPLDGPSRLAPVTADTLLGIFESLFKENWGIRTADVLSAALLTLARTPGANLLWLTPLLTDPAFRRKVLKASSDPLGTGAFWQQYEAKTPTAQAAEIAPVLNKLRQLILRPGLRAILGQSEPRFHISDVFTKRRILIVNLNRGLIGNDAARLLGTLLMGQLWSQLLARQSLPPTRRAIVPIYVDEVHDFIAGLQGDLSDALAQARSLGGAFTLAHQYRAQLDSNMQQAVDANTRSKIYFGLNGHDAAAVSKHADDLVAQDFMLLPKYHAYANVMQNGGNTGWVSISTRPAPPAKRDASDIYAASHERYGIPADQTEKEILDLITAGSPTPGEEEISEPIGRKEQ